MKISEVINSSGLNEIKQGALELCKSILPTWPQYVVKDWIYQAVKDQPSKENILAILADLGLTVDTKWTLFPQVHFQFDKMHPDTQRDLIARSGGTLNPKQVPRDAERHAKQAELARAEGGIRREPVICLKTTKGLYLLEGWHRTDRKSTRLNSSHIPLSRMPSSA